MKAAALVLALLATAARPCGLELVLAADVSGSIDAAEYRLQVEGMATAFEDPRVGGAIARVPGGIAVVFTQWSGASRQKQVTGWHLLGDAEGARAFAGVLRGTAREWRNFSTAVGEALLHADRIGRTAPVTCRRRVIDISGDGITNEGQPPRPVAAMLAAGGWTINALVIRGALPDPVPHFRDEVIAGPGAFLETARDFEDFPRAFLQKLLREIDPPMVVSGH